MRISWRYWSSSVRCSRSLFAVSREWLSSDLYSELSTREIALSSTSGCRRNIASRSSIEYIMMYVNNISTLSYFNGSFIGFLQTVIIMHLFVKSQSTISYWINRRYSCKTTLTFCKTNSHQVSLLATTKCSC